MRLKDELQSIISGISGQAGENLIQAAANHLRKGQKTSPNTKKNEFLSKEQEAAELIKWVDDHNLWFRGHNEDRFISSGAEQRVYLDDDERFVYKLNDTIFYERWLDYFHSLLLHNHFFPTTSYQLIGFFKASDCLFAVVKQPYIEITESTDTTLIKDFLYENGFLWKRNNDYYNPELGLILEDLHEENVLTNKSVMFFIDTIFYLEDSFFAKE